MNVIHFRKIKIALLGCGRIAHNHFAAISLHAPDLELVGVADTDEKAMKAAAESQQVPGFLSLSELLKHTDADLISVCTPSGLHPEHTIEIAQAKRHVLTEKPMATTWEAGLRMVKACEDNQVKLFVVKQNRLNPTIQLLKKAIDQDRFGKIYLVVANVFWTRPQSYYDQAAWRGTWALDGGAFMNQASHYVDLVQWLLGPVSQVQAFTATLGRRIEAEDTGVVALRWQSGTLGTMNVSMLTYPKNFEGSITILGEKGTVRIGGVAVNEIEHWEFLNPDPQDEMILKSNYETTSVYGHGHPVYYQNVIEVLRGKGKAMTNGVEGLTSLALLTAIYDAAKTEKIIQLPKP